VQSANGYSKPQSYSARELPLWPFMPNSLNCMCLLMVGTVLPASCLWPLLGLHCSRADTILTMGVAAAKVGLEMRKNRDGTLAALPLWLRNGFRLSLEFVHFLAVLRPACSAFVYLLPLRPPVFSIFVAWTFRSAAFAGRTADPKGLRPSLPRGGDMRLFVHLCRKFVASLFLDGRYLPAAASH